MEPDVVTLFKQGGFALVALAALGWILKKIGERMIAAIDKLTETVQTGTTAMTKAITDSERAHSEAINALTQRVARIEGMALVAPGGGGGDRDFSDEPTGVGEPIEDVRQRATPVRGTPTVYGPMRPSKAGGGVR
jgi:hypothetical protein